MTEHAAAEPPPPDDSTAPIPVAPSKARWFEKIADRIDFSLQLKALTHFVVVAILLAALNWMFSKGDPGWLKLNPSPWVLLPFYMGFRFGFFWGISSGLLLMFSRIWLATSSTPEGEAIGFGGGDFFLIWGVVLMGAVGGFSSGVIRRRETQKDIALDEGESSNERLRNQVALLKHNEQDLASILVSQGLESSGLTLSLQDIIDQYAEEDRDEAFLQLIRDRCGVKSAAIYYSAKDGGAVRVAHLIRDGAFPEAINKTTMIEHAERTGKIITQRWFWEPFEPNATGGLDDYFLAVIAHRRDRDYRVLIISRMDFEQINWENFWRLESAFRWFEHSLYSKNAVRFEMPEIQEQDGFETRQQIIDQDIRDRSGLSLHPEPEPEPEIEQLKPVREILDGPGFKQRLQHCRQIERQMGLEHRLVVFVPEETEDLNRCEEFATSLTATMPPSDDLARIPSDGGRFVYGLLTEAHSTAVAEAHTNKLLEALPDLELRFFVLQLNDAALSAFEN